MKQLFKTTLLLLAILLPTVATAYDFEVDGIYYNINGNEATITNSGTSIFDMYLADYSGDFVIPETVTYNGVTYPITAIGEYAFSGCIDLTSITFPNSITSIEFSAFDGCSSLTNIEIPSTVTAIGNGAFCFCSNLSSIKVASDNQYYDSRDNCNAIIETASNSLLIGCKSSVILNSITAISYGAFAGCTITNIEIPNSVTAIGDQAFYYCNELTSIEIPNSVTTIDERAFEYCSSLMSIRVSKDNQYYDSRDNCNAIIETSSNTMIAGCKNTIIPNTVTSIGNNAFSGCTELTSIEIPNSVISICNEAFNDCSRLTNIEIPNSVISIGSLAFWDCYCLTKIEIPNSVTSIGWNAFTGCFRLTSIEIGNSVTAIDNYAFYDCSSVQDVYCYAPVPPTCEENTFTYYSATLHVPAASLAAYFTAPYWCNFESIVGDAVAPTGITISEDSVEADLDDEFRLTATVTPTNASNKNISWRSTNTDVATVENGMVTVIGFGECDIIASCFGMRAVCHVSAHNKISLDQQEVMLLPNHMLSLTPSATVLPEGFTVTSSEPMVAAARVMNGKVQVVGVTEGTATITVGSTDGLAIPATCIVTVYTEPGDVNMDGFVNITDVTRLINYLLTKDPTGIKIANADFYNDGLVNIKDVTTLINQLLTTGDQRSRQAAKALSF